MKTRRGWWLYVAAVSAALVVQSGEARQGPSAGEPVYRYRPTYRVPPSLEAVRTHLTAGSDAFPEESIAEQIARELTAFGDSLRERPSLASEAAGRLLSAAFEGGRLAATIHSPRDRSSRLEVQRTFSRLDQPALGRDSFIKELTALFASFSAIDVAEFLVTGIEAAGASADTVATSIRYDLSGRAEGASRVERTGQWRMRWRRAGERWKVVEWTAVQDVTARAVTPVFTEVTGPAFGRNRTFTDQLGPGLDEWISRLDATFMPGGMGHHGVSVGDADGDGLDDLYVSQPSGLPNRLFRNNGDGSFSDITEAAGLAVLDSTSQSLFADIDNDGDQDLILVTRGGPLLFTNDAGGRFTHRPDAFQLAGPLRGTLTSAAMADYDRDGLLDLYLCSYSFLIGASEDKAGPPLPYHDAENGPPNVLLRNAGGGRFVEMTEAAGLSENNDRFSFAAAWGDYDGDGWPDLLVANDFGRKNLYRNLGPVDGHVRFEDVAELAGVNDHGAGMSAAFLDYDSDGHLDIYTGNMWTAAGLRVTGHPAFMPQAPPEVRALYRRHARGNSLFRNRGNGTFSDVTLEARAEFGRWAWASDALDFDSDGWEDLYVVNGMFTRGAADSSVDVDSFFWRQVVARSPLVRQTGTAYDDAWRATNRLLMAHGTQAGHERNVLLRNDTRGGFDEVTGVAGLDLDQDGRSFAILDHDGDGDPDLVTMAARSAPQLRLFRNDFAAKPGALAVRLVGTRSNRDAVGARVTVDTDRGRLTRLVKAGSGFISQHSKELLIGLGAGARVTKLTIQWPSGAVQAFRDVSANRRIRVTEGSDVLQAEPLGEARPLAEVPSALARADSGLDAGTWLYQPYPAPPFRVRDLSGQEWSLAAFSGRPAVLLFWTTSAPPSVRALEELSRQQPSLREAGVAALALALDVSDDGQAVVATAKSAGVPIAIAGGEIAGRYSLLHRYVFDRREDLRLPTVFLLNARGEVTKVYRELTGGVTLVKDAQQVDAGHPERLRRALPFAGAFYAPPGERSYFQYALELAEQGFDDASLAAFERAAALEPSAITFYNLGTLYMRGGRSADARAAFERSLQLQPGYPDANNSLGVLIAQSGDLDPAIARFSAALEVRPDFADALNNLGYAWLQRGEAVRARELFEKALALQPDFPEALNNMGILFGRQGDLDRALAFFQRAVERRGTYGEAANNLALVLAARGESGSAVLVLQQLLRESPEFEPAYVTLARIHLKEGSLTQGTQVLEQLLQRNPRHPLGLELLEEVRAAAP